MLEKLNLDHFDSKNYKAFLIESITILKDTIG